MIRVEQPTQRLLETTWLSYMDVDGKLRQSRLSNLPRVGQNRDVLTVPDVLADPALISIVSRPGPANLPVLCPTTPSGDKRGGVGHGLPVRTRRGAAPA